jgi:TPR repeat protein
MLGLSPNPSPRATDAPSHGIKFPISREPQMTELRSWKLGSIGVGLLVFWIISEVVAGELARPTTKPTTSKTVHLHKDTGFRFPDRFRKFRFLRVTKFDTNGRNIAVGYSSLDSLAQLTLYVYPASRGTMGPAIRFDTKGKRTLSKIPGQVFLLTSHSDSYGMEYRNVVRNILAAHQGWKVLRAGKSRRQAIPAQNGPVSYVTVFSGKTKGIEVHSELLLFVSHGYFVKVRLTYPAGRWLEYSYKDEFPRTDVADDQQETVKHLRRAAEAGDFLSMHMLSLAYLEGRGIRMVPEAAVPWCLRAAKGGYAPAMRSLGGMHKNGTGVGKNDVGAFKWYRAAADRGDVPAMHEVGIMYSDGRGVAKDMRQAMAWCKKAAEGGLVDAMYSLALFYLPAKGKPGRPGEAVKWLKRAVSKMDVPSMDLLGRMLLGGLGIDKNERDGVVLIQKAADLRYGPAMFLMGRLYAEGRVVPKSVVKAKKWLGLAAAAGDKDAANALEAMKQPEPSKAK